MKIAVNARFLLPRDLEGIGWYTHEIVQRMAHQHPEDEFMLLLDRHFDHRHFLYAPNVKAVVLPPPARHPLLWYMWFEAAIPLYFRSYKPNVFFSPDSYLSLLTKVPTVMTVHDIIPLQYPESIQWWHRPYYIRNMPKFNRRADHIVTVSEFTKQSIVETGTSTADKITVIYNGCRDTFRPIDALAQQAVRDQYSAGQPYFFYTGSIHPRKNLPSLIRAFDRFKDATGALAKLLIAGRFAWQTGETTAAYERARHRADIHFMGYVPESELPRLTAAAHAMVYVSHNEGFGLPILEAMYCDVPVLCSNITAIPEVAGKAALQVDPYSEDAITAGLHRIYADEALRVALRAQMPAQRAQFDWDSAAAAVYECLQRTAKF